MVMNQMLLNLLAQIPSDKLDQVAPKDQNEGSTMVAWMIIGVLALGIIAVAFKTSKRTHMVE